MDGAAVGVGEGGEGDEEEGGEFGFHGWGSLGGCVEGAGFHGFGWLSARIPTCTHWPEVKRKACVCWSCHSPIHAKGMGWGMGKGCARSFEQALCVACEHV